MNEVVLDIEFITNMKVCAINVAEFTLPNGTKLTVDRKRTEYRIVKDKASGEYHVRMYWYECYLWAINDCHIFDTEEAQILNKNEFARLLEGAILDIIPEDDVKGYEVYPDDVNWCFVD